MDNGGCGWYNKRVIIIINNVGRHGVSWIIWLRITSENSRLMQNAECRM